MDANEPRIIKVEGYNRVSDLMPGDFGILYYNSVNEVRVPVEVLRAAHRAAPTVRSGVLVAEFLQAAFTRGSVMALALDWAPSDVYQAARKMNNRLAKAGAIKDITLIP